MEENIEFQIKILTEIMKKQQELINNIFNIVEKDYIEKSKFEEDETIIEEMAKYIKNPYEVITIGSRKPKIEIIKEYFRNKVKENKE